MKPLIQIKYRFRSLASRRFKQFIILVLVLFSNVSSSSQSILKEMTEALQRYIQIPSIHGNEKSAGEYLKHYAQDRGLHVEVLTAEESSYNLVISLYPLSWRKPNILLLSHLDVVDPGPLNEWAFPPYSATISGDTIWGRGALDNKSNTIMHLFALIKLYKEIKQGTSPGSDYNISLLVMSDEENGGTLGAQLVVKKYWDLLHPVMAIGEGPQGINQLIPTSHGTFIHSIAISNKNKVLLEVVAKNTGQQLHAAISSPNSANNKLITALNKIKNKKEKIALNTITIQMLKSLAPYETGIKKLALRHPGLFKPLIRQSIRKSPDLITLLCNTHNITQIVHPDLLGSNIIPGHSKAWIDCRLQPHISITKYVANLCKGINKKEVSIHSYCNTREQLISPVNHIYYTILESALHELFPNTLIMPAQMPYTSDCQYFRAKGLPVYSFTPVQLAPSFPKSAHGINEHFLISALDQGYKAYIQIFKKLLEHGQTVVRPATNQEADRKSLSANPGKQ